MWDGYGGETKEIQPKVDLGVKFRFSFYYWDVKWQYLLVCALFFLALVHCSVHDRLLINTESMFPLISSPITVNLARAVFS